jgi:hypothetical protein
LDTTIVPPVPAEIVVPIEIRNMPPFDEFGFDLTYDDTTLEFIECRRSPFTAVCPSPGDPNCFDDLSCFDSPGTVRIGGFSASGNETPGPSEILCEVVFLLIDPTATSTQLETTNFFDDFSGLGILDCKGTITFVVPEVCPLDATVAVPAPKTGGEVVVDIEIRDMPPFDEFGFDLNYDQATLAFVECLRSPFTEACTNPGDPGCFDDLTCFDSPGVVRVGGFSASGDETPGNPEILCHLVFQPIDPIAATGQLLTNNYFDDFAERGILDCQGIVTFDPQGTGDVNDSGTLTPADALCSFKCFLSFGDITLPPFNTCNFGTGVEINRVDVDCDGNCTVADADFIFNRWLECGGAPAHCFAEDGTACPESFPGGESGIFRTQTRMAELRLGTDTRIVRGDPARIPVQVRGSGSLSKFGLDLSHSSGLEVIGFEPAGDVGEWGGLGAGLGIPGVVRLGGFGGEISLSSSRWTDLGNLLVRARLDASSAERFELVAGMADLEQASLAGGRIPRAAQ